MRGLFSALALGSVLAMAGFAAEVPEIPIESVPNFLKMPDGLYMGEAVGVATNSKGHVFVFTRSGETRLFEFDENGKWLREIGDHLYSFAFAHTVRVDRYDNIWATDEGTNMIVKFDPQGHVIMTFGRRPEAGEGVTPWKGDGAGIPEPTRVTKYGLYRPTDVAWDAQDNVFVSDGYGNSRVIKYSKEGRFITSVGDKRGSAPGQFNTPHTIATDRDGNVYVGDRGNNRIQVFDNNLKYKTSYTAQGAPWAICISPGTHQYLYSSNSTGTTDMKNGEIYKMELDGTIIGKFGRGGKKLGEFMATHEIDCRYENQILTGEVTNWRVQKILLKK